MHAHARNGLIDCLRGLAAISVAVFHFNELHPTLHDPYHVAVKMGWLGVTVFFVVSGYCIAGARERDAMPAFWCRRVLRIYPPLWGSLLLVAAIAVTARLATGTNDIAVLPKSTSEVFYTIAGLTTPASSVRGMNWVYWSLGYEIAFYAIVGLLFVRRSTVGLAMFGVLAMLCSSWGYPFNEWGLFQLGIGAQLLVSGRTRAAIALVALSSCQMAVTQSRAEWVAAGGTLLLLLFAPTVFSTWWAAPLRWFGRISYSLYLVHVPLGCYVALRWFGHSPGPVWAAVLRDIGLLAFCAAGAAAFYAVIERPAHEFARRWPPRVRVAGPGSMSHAPGRTGSTVTAA